MFSPAPARSRKQLSRARSAPVKLSPAPARSRKQLSRARSAPVKLSPAPADASPVHASQFREHIFTNSRFVMYVVGLGYVSRPV